MTISIFSKFSLPPIANRRVHATHRSIVIVARTVFSNISCIIKTVPCRHIFKNRHTASPFHNCVVKSKLFYKNLNNSYLTTLCHKFQVPIFYFLTIFLVVFSIFWFIIEESSSLPVNSSLTPSVASFFSTIFNVISISFISVHIE